MHAESRFRTTLRMAWRLVQVAFSLTWLPLRRLLVWAPRHEGPWKGVAADGVVDAFEALGPTYVKLGQLIASSPGLFPAPLSEACRSCLDRVAPVPAADVRRVVEEDLGAPADALFARFEDEPLAAASTAQVHAVVLLDGDEAVVKVQRPGIAAVMTTDLRILHGAARLAARTKRAKAMNPVGIVEDLQRVTTQELDLEREARQQIAFTDSLHHFGDNQGTTAPEVIPELCGPRVLCMERVRGRPFDRLGDVDEELGQRLLAAAVKPWIEAACLHGPFHGDVHAGNLWVLDDGRVCFLDFGITGELEPGWQRLFTVLLGVFTDPDGDFAPLAQALMDVQAIPAEAGSAEDVGPILAGVIGPLIDQDLAELSLAETLRSSVQVFESFGATVPTELVLVLKQLLYFERYAKDLAPGWTIARDASLSANVQAAARSRA
jgi:predicted unusual protein kinase regulating ubiquinone biosynthesis (AarF/ABC1/UbiB family)